MAARLNFRLILILVIVLGAIGATAGTALFIKLRFDAERHIVKGDEAMSEGDGRRAAIQYRRGISKDRANIEYVVKLRDAVASIVPQTDTEARQFFAEYVNCFSHIATHRPTETEHHLRSIAVSERVAVATDVPVYWQRVQESAESMLQRIPEGTPGRDEALLARGRALGIGARQAYVSADELASGRSDLDSFDRAHPADPRGWAALVRSHAAEAMSLATSDPTAAAHAFGAALGVLESGQKSGASGTPLDLALVELAGVQVLLGRQEAALSDAAVADARRRIVDDLGANVAPLADDPAGAWMADAIDAVRVLGLGGDPGRDAARDLMARIAAREPRSMVVAGHLVLLTLAPKTSEAVAATMEAAQAVLAMPVPTISYEAINYWLIREAAAFGMFEAAGIAWERDGSPRPTTDGAVPPTLATLREMGDRYAKLVGDAAPPRRRAYVDAYRAFADGDWVRAASLFDALVTAEDGDARTRLYAAYAVEQLGQLGRAATLYDDLLPKFPKHPLVLKNALRVFWKLRNAEKAQDLATRLIEVTRSESEPEGDELAQTVLAEIARLDTGEKTPYEAALEAATERAQADDIPGAEAALEAVLPLVDDRERAAALESLSGLAAARGASEEAVARLDEALAILPGNPRLEALREIAAIDDPIRRTELLSERQETDPAERAGRVLLAVRNLRLGAARAAAAAETGGDAATAAEQRDVAARAEAREQAILAGLDAAARDSRLVIRYRFSEAIEDEDWPTARSLLAPARAANADDAEGTFLEGTLAMAMGAEAREQQRIADAQARFAEAIRAFTRASELLPFSSRPRHQLAEAYLAAGNQEEARRQLEAAYAVNPTDHAASLRLVELASRTGASTRALAVIREMRRLRPKDEGIRSMWLGLEEDNGFVGTVLRERRTRLAERPDDLQNAVALVQMLANRTPDRDSILDADGNPRYAGQRWTVMKPADREEAIRQEQARWQSEADRIVAAIDTPDRRPIDRLVLAMIRANLLLDRGDAAGAERVVADMAPVMKVESERIAQQLALADLQWRTGNPAASFATLGRLPDGVVDGASLHWALAGRYAESQRWNDQIATLESMVTDDLDDQIAFIVVSTASAQIVPATTTSRDILRQVAKAHLQAGRVAEAERSLARVTEGRPMNFRDTYLQLEILQTKDLVAASGDDAAAKEAAARALAAALDAFDASWPNEPGAMLVRARRAAREYALRGEPEALARAFQYLEKVEQRRAGDRQATMLRYDLKRLSGDAEGAIGELQSLVDANPMDDEMRTLYVRELVAAGRERLAMEVVQAAIDLYGAKVRAATWHELMSSIKDRGDDEDGAIASLRAAFDVDPSARRLGQLCTRMLDKKRVETADHLRIEGMMNQNARLLDEQPTLRLILARSLLMQRDQDRRAQAQAHVQESFAAQKRLIEARRADAASIVGWINGLGRELEIVPMDDLERLVLQLVGGQPDDLVLFGLASAWRLREEQGYARAIELYSQVRERTKERNEAVSRAALLELGNTYLQAERFDEAVRIFGEVLTADANNVFALNNLAYILAERLGRPSEALPHALRAVGLARANASILDTAGCVQFRLGAIDEAIGLLRRSVDIAEEPANLAHLAEALLARGDLDGARDYSALAERTLRAMKDPTKSDEELVQRVLAEVRAKSGGG